MATKTRGSGWNAAVLGILPNQNFKVKVLNRANSGSVMVGMAIFIDPNGQNYNQRGWYLYVNNGTLYSQQGDNNRQYATAVNNGSVIEVVFDVTQRNMSFVIDGVNKGIAFNNLPVQDLFPALDIHEQNVAIEIIE